MTRLVNNARVLQDSINSFEFLKLKIKPIKSQLQACTESRNALAIELSGVRKDANQLGEKLAISDARAATYKRQRNQARLEVWLMRAGAAAALYFMLIPK